MNKNLHRIVFNAARGMRMVVQETARSAGKAASGTTLAVAVLAAWPAAPAGAQIAADPNAPGRQRPTVLATPDGAPLVNIQTPSAAGVSRNLYRQFDVGSQGAVLNNSRTAVQTRLAGQVPGNPWLAQGPARIILNEVNSADPSQLRGFVEVAGQRAEVVIANPAGIQVDGAGFINASRATLTTGTAQFSADGGLAGFLVRGGTIRIEGAGLDASTTDYAAILSRALQVNAGIWANELKAVIGSGEVSADAGTTQPAAGHGTAPVFALDVAALGGMYAGKITLVGTEAGVGVRNAGHIGAGVGGLVVTAAGRLENTGTLEGGRVELASGEDIHNRGGQIRQAGAMDLQLAAAAIRNSGGGQIGAPTPAAAAPATPGTGIDPATPATPATPAAPGATPPSDVAPAAPPAATAPGSLRATGTIHNEGGRILTSGTIALQAPQIDNGGGTLHLDRMDFRGERFSNAGGTLQVRGDFSARTADFDNAGGQLAAARLDIASSGRIANAGGVLASAGAALLSAGGLLDNGDGSITAAGALDVQAGALHNRGALRSDSTLTLTVDGQIANNGSISAAGPLQVTAGTLHQQADGVLAAGLLADGRREATATLQLRTRDALDNRGGVLEAGRVAIDAGTLANTDGGRILQAGAGSARIAVTGTLDNRGGRILAESRDFALQAARLANGGGRIDHAGTGSLDITATQLDGGDGAIHSSGTLTLSAREATHAGSLQAHALRIDAAQLVNRGEIVQTGSAAMRIAATQRLDNAGGRIAGNATDMSLQAAQLDNTGGRIEHAGTGQLLLQAERLDGNAGRIVGNGALRLQAAQIAHGNGASMAAEHIAIDTARLANTGGEITQRGEQAMRIDATEALDNTGGRIGANAQDMRLQSAHLTNAGGRIEHAGHGQLAIAATRLDGGDGSIAGNGALALRADTLAQAGSLQAAQVDIAARVLDNRGGSIVQTGEQAMRIAARERLDNRGGRIAGSAHNLDLAAGTLDNGTGRIEHVGQGLLAIDAARLDGDAGRIVGNGVLRIQAGQIAHGNGASMVAEQITIDTEHLANRGGEIVQRGSQAMRIAATEALDNTGGRIAGNGQDMALQSAHMSNTRGRIEHAGSGALTITADRLDGGSGSIVGNGALALRADVAALAGSLQARQVDIATRVLDNRGGRIVQTGDEAMRLVATERVDNSGGHIAGNAKDLRIEAALLVNTGGHIEHAGQGLLALQADHLDGNAGRIVGNGALQVDADRITHGNGASMVAAQVTIATRHLANAGGEIVQTGSQAMRIRADALLDNTGGRIAGNAQDMALQSARIANADGRIEHAGTGTLAIAATELEGGDGHIVGNSVLQLRADRAALAGSLQAAQVDIAVGTLDNRGEIVQTGSGAMQLTATGRLGNQGGRIAGNATDLHLQAATLDNTGGTIEHAGSGLLRLAAERIDGNAGRIVGNGALQVTATQIAHGGGAHMTAGQITIDTARLANTGGEIVQRGAQAMRITATEALDNAGGRIAGHAQDMALKSQHLTNDNGRIEHAGSGQLSIDAGRLDGGNGSIVGNGALVLRADAIAQAGSLQAGTVDIAARTLDNRGGRIVQTGDAAMHIVATERLDNAGGQIAGNAVDLTLRAATLDNTGGSIEHAGSGLLALQAERLDGNAGRIVGNGALRVEAGQIAHGAGASMAAEHIAIAATHLANTGGEIVQRGTQAMQVDATEVLDNTGGRIAGSGQDMALQSAHITNAGGRIEHAGSGKLSITTARLDGGDGHIVGNGVLSLHADTLVHAGSLQASQVDIDTRTLDNRGGRIVQTGGEAMRIAATEQIDNRGGRIAGNAQHMAIATATLANAGGEIAHAGSGQLGISVGHLEGGDGRIVGNGELAIQASSLVQHGTLQADRITIDAGTLGNAGEIVHTGDAAMRISTTGLLDNRGGRIAGNGQDMALQASHLMNAGGRIEHAGTGTLTLAAPQVDGGDGQVIGNGALALQADSLTHAGQMRAARLALEAGQLTNTGEIVQTGAGSARVKVDGLLDNRGGLIATAVGSGADLALSAAQVRNEGGRLQADAALALQAGTDLHNTGGLVRGGSALDVLLGGQLHNNGGALEAAGPAATLALQAAAIANQDGRIVNAGHGASHIAAASIVNGGTTGLIGANGTLQLSTTTLDNQAGALLSAGQSLDLAVTTLVRNRGDIASDGSLTLQQAGAQLDNAGGSIVTAGSTRIDVAQLKNDGGRIATAAGSQADLAVSAASLSNAGGTLSSDRDLALQLGGDHQHTGLVHAERNLALTVQGTLSNPSTLQAAGTLTVQAAHIVNLAGGSIEAGHVALHATGTLHNAGEIGGNSAALHADTLHNQAAITAGDLTITARTIDNTGPQALIGATGDVTLQATQAVSNVDGAMVYAGRDIQIATGALLNRSATVEAGRDIGIDAGTVLNQRPGVVVEQVVTVDERHTMTMPSWWHNADRNSNRYAPEGTNYSAYQVFYVNPADILEHSTVYTPDGYAIGRVVVRTHANDTVFFSGRAGRANQDGQHFGHRERQASTDGTRVLYYTQRQDGMPNPDQVAGVTSGVWEDALVHTWSTPEPAFSAAYGSCSTDCIRLVTPLDYTDPTTTMIRDTQHVRGPNTSLSEIGRDTHVTATEDRPLPGAAAQGRIAAGGNIRVHYAQSLTNEHSDIVAGGLLDVQGDPGSQLLNQGTTLKRTWRFEGTRRYADGVTAEYRQPELTEVIGSIGGLMHGGQGVDIRGGTIRNIDTSAGGHANITANVQLSTGTVPQGTGPQRIQNAMLAAQAGTGASALGQAIGAAAGQSASASAAGAAREMRNGVDSQSGNALAATGKDAQVHAGRAATSGGTAVGREQSGLASVGQASAQPTEPGRGSLLPTLPGGLFQLRPDAGQTLYTTHARFANARPWVSSDSMLQTLGLDPAQTLKRLGDGFLEQQRIREQVTELTGRRTLAGHIDDDAQYAALLNAGASYAQALGLRVGVALTAAQMAQLTSDIVWLERQAVTLPDGSVQEVLAPRLYLAHLGEGALRPTGALITGGDVRLQGEDILNRGGVIGQASTGRTVLVASRDIVNQGGTVQGMQVALAAGRDVRNESLSITRDWGSSNDRASVAGSHTSMAGTARIQAGQSLQIQAGQDVRDVAGHIGSGGALRIQAGRDIVLDTLQTGHDSRLQAGAGSVTNSSTQAHVGRIAAGSDLAIAAGRDLQAVGTQASAGGNVNIAAGRHIEIQAASSSAESDRRNDETGTRFRQSASTTTVQGASVQAGGNLAAHAGIRQAGDLHVTGSALQAQGSVQLNASQDVVLDAAQTRSERDDYHHGTRSGMFSKRSTTQRDAVSVTGVAGSTVSGDTVALAAGRDITAQAATLHAEGAMQLSAARDIALGTAEQTVTETHLKDVRKSATGLGKLTGLALGGGSIAQTAIVGGKLISSNAALANATQTQTQAIGSTVSAGSLHMASGRDTAVTGSKVVADHDITVLAGRDLTIESAQDTLNASQRTATRKSGSVGTLTNPALGNIQQSQSGQASSVTQSASQLASLQGDVTLVAGNTYTQTASSVLAAGQGGALVGGDVRIQAREVVIGEAFDTEQSDQRSRSSSTVLGGSASVAGFSTDSLRQAASTVQAIGDTGDARMQALGAVNLAMQGKQAYDTAMAIANGGSLGYKVTASISHNKSESQSTSSSRDAVGSSILAADQVRIVATGGAADSNIRVTGSTIGAGSTAHLQADNAIDLQASQNTWTQQGSHRSSGASVGVGFGTGAQTGFTIELGVSQGKGVQNGSEVVHTNTHVTAGQAVHLTSGGDLALKGAVVEGARVSADVGGQLHIESLQDTSEQIARQSSSGLNLSLCIPPICYGVSTVSGSVAAAKANGSYASVVEQSGIKAGDGGFQVQVQGATQLTGGVISSSQVAVDTQANRFDTASLASSDIHNHSTYKASSYALSASASGGLGDQSTARTPAQKKAADDASKAEPDRRIGVGSASGSEHSTTTSGISGIAGDTTVRTGDAGSTGALVKDWNVQALLQDVQARAQITQEFGPHASAAIGRVATTTAAELRLRAEDETDPAARQALLDQAANWDEGGIVRVALHAAAGWLSGGTDGALGAASSAALTPVLAQSIADLSIPADAKLALIEAVGTTIGAVAGGAKGAAAGLNETAHNYVRFLQLAMRMAQLGVDKLDKVGVATLQACVTNRACLSLVQSSLPAGAVAWLASQTNLVANPPSAADLIPTGYGDGLQPKPLGPLVTPVADQQYNSGTATPGDAKPVGGTPGYVSPDPVGNTSTVTENRGPQQAYVAMSGQTYVPSLKHDPVRGWGTPMNLSDKDAQQVLDESVLIGRQRYGFMNGSVYEFMDDNSGGWHGYPIPGNQAPVSVLRSLRDSGTISNVEYDRLRRGK